MEPLPSFTEYFRAFWGCDPFPWQTRLAMQATEGPWPEWITLPTGTGKTSVIDVAVYALASQASLPPAERQAPVRIVFAVNRRIVVDEAFDRAKSIADKLKEALADSASTLHPIASALQTLADDPSAPPLEAFPLRGGTFTDRSWARSAFQPIILSTTLDQLGSRLLFRGYGVTEYARPIHAALLANDSLLILDEAHTATAFSQTLNGIARLREQAAEDLSLPFQTVQLTATPPSEAPEPFRLSSEDEAHPVISSRLRASKPFECILVADAKGKARHKKLAEAMAEKARAYLDEGHRRILVVVNRVATAEALLEQLRPRRKGASADCRVEFLTGRLRPLDRDALVRSLAEVHQLKSGEPAADVPPLILVATQCIEVGADFDFDALLSELAPLDNLRQRFGRLNRYGRERISPAAIFAPEEAIATAEPKKLLAEVKATKSSDLMVCVRTQNTETALEIKDLLEKEFQKNLNEEDQANDNSLDDVIQEWVPEGDLSDLANSSEPSSWIRGHYGLNSEISQADQGMKAVLLCTTSGKVTNSKAFRVKNIPKSVLGIDQEELDASAEELELLFAKFSKSVAKDLGKHPVLVIPVPEHIPHDLIYNAISEAINPRTTEVLAFGSCDSREKVLCETSKDVVDAIRKDAKASRRIVVVPRDQFFLSTAHANVTIGVCEDPIYGNALPEVWSWLGTLANPDFGLSALGPQLPEGDELAALLAPTADAPILLPPHLDLLCQTSPEPHVSPDPALYIHGPQQEFPEVSVLLRDDLDDFSDPLAALRVARPLATESASLPLHLVRQWLTSPNLADDSGDAPAQVTNARPGAPCSPIPLWRQGDAVSLNDPAELRPGDKVIVPPDRRESISTLFPGQLAASDQYEEAHLLARDRLSIRFGRKQRDRLATDLPDATRADFLNLVSPCFTEAEGEEDEAFDFREWSALFPEIARTLAEGLSDDHPQHGLWRLAAWKDAGATDPKIRRDSSDWKIVPYPDATQGGILATNLSRCGSTPWPYDPEEVGRQGNESANKITLDAHSAGVTARAERAALRLAGELADCVKKAAMLHDIGKLDPRFQALLHGCFLHAVAGREILAKSGRPIHPKQDSLLFEALSLPRGFRHELLSARIVADSAELLEYPERDLLLHLIASHHGRCRGFAPIVLDDHPEPFEVRALEFSAICPGYSAPLASLRDGVPARFWALNRRFGWWGLAYLETLLRLADQAESASPNQP